MRILVVGSGGREHALVVKLLKSANVSKVFVAPGNGGTALSGATNVQIEASAINDLVNFAKEQAIDLVVVGPELPLTLGITDLCQEVGIPCFGPDKFAAKLEGSKAFAKEIMAKANVPTAQVTVVDNLQAAEEVLAHSAFPIVVKADGLAQGKGVVICADKAKALECVKSMLSERVFGDAGAKILLEEYLEGEEVSLLAFCDGTHAKPMPSAQDHKRAFDHDQGLNTGGMGAYSPAPILPDKDLEHMADLTIRPILKVMQEAGHPFVGVLYAGLMITKTGPKVLEYNVRFGDPECQPLLLRLNSDLCAIMLACVQHNLAATKLEFSDEASLGVVIAKQGYPQSYTKGSPILGLAEAEQVTGVTVFHSGTALQNNTLVSSGGRILCVTAKALDLQTCQHNAYAAVRKITIENSFYRTDIGSKGLAHLANN